MRVRLNLAYDGDDFFGWQLQPDERTVQGELEHALSRFYGGAELRCHASGRTDSGVHAVGQVVHYDAPVERDVGTIQKGLNALLPDGIRLWRVKIVADDFHARFSARGRTYAYRLLKAPDIFLRHFGWSVNNGFDLSRAETVARTFIGSHDFRAFSTRPDPEESTVCDVRSVHWHEDDYGWVIHIEADRYIRRMVRTLTGAIVACSEGRFDPDLIPQRLETGKGPVPAPAPANGLALLHVQYEDNDAGDLSPRSLWGPFESGAD